MIAPSGNRDRTGTGAQSPPVSVGRGFAASSPVRPFPTFTGDLHRLAEWLTACRVTHVAIDAQDRTRVVRRLRQRAEHLGFGLVNLSTGDVVERSVS